MLQIKEVSIHNKQTNGQNLEETELEGQFTKGRRGHMEKRRKSHQIGTEGQGDTPVDHLGVSAT